MATRALAAPVGEILMAFESITGLAELLARDETLDGMLLADDLFNEDVLKDETLSEEALNDETVNDEIAEETLLPALDAGLELLLPPLPPPPPQATNTLQVAAAIVGVKKCLNEINVW